MKNKGLRSVPVPGILNPELFTVGYTVGRFKADEGFYSFISKLPPTLPTLSHAFSLTFDLQYSRNKCIL